MGCAVAELTQTLKRRSWVRTSAKETPKCVTAFSEGMIENSKLVNSSFPYKWFACDL